MINRATDPRTDDTIVYELLRAPRGGAEESIGRATFRAGRATVDAPEAVSVAVSELLERGFVDRVRADERPRGYRRSAAGGVDMLVPGMPEHFIARLRGLWLPYPDGSVVTAREAGIVGSVPAASLEIRDAVEPGPPVTDPSVRRATLAEANDTIGTRPLVRANSPAPGVRPMPTMRRTDCGWIA
jgi:hypothetical protein